LVAATKPKLAIVDLTLKTSNGMELIKDLRNQFPAVHILVLSMHDETIHAERAIRAGARGYITKQEATNAGDGGDPAGVEWRDLLERTRGGTVASKIAGPAQAAGALPTDCLTDREFPGV